MGMVSTYTVAKRQGERAMRRAFMEGQYPYVTALEDFVGKADIAGEIELGLYELPLSSIVGTRTRDRANSFSPNFMPVLKDSTEFASKWEAVYEHQVTDGIQDPVKCYEFMHRFYVEEGNKRVSVLKFVGAYSIMARVIRLLPKRTEEVSHKVYYEYLDFFNVTGLLGVEYTKPGCYEKLASLLGETLDKAWPAEKVEAFSSARSDFLECYYNMKLRRTDATGDDAFLIYLSVHKDGLTCDDMGTIRYRISQLQNEFMTEMDRGRIRLVETPERRPQGKEWSRVGVLPIYVPAKSAYYSAERPLRAAFIYAKKPENSSWVYGHELGRNEVETAFGGVVVTTAYPDCTGEEKAQAAISAAIEAGNDVIFTTSPSMMPVALRNALDNPKVKFLNCSINQSVNAVRTYYARMYEARFMMGALAASLAEDHRIGYLADYPIYGTIAQINAFAAGAAMVDPRCHVVLKWTGTEQEAHPELSLAAEGVRVMLGPDFINPEAASRAYGLFTIMPDGQFVNLAAPMHNWGTYYRLILAEILDGTYGAVEEAEGHAALNYWYGMSAGVVDVVFGKKVPAASRKLMELIRGAIVSGAMLPFDGEIVSQTGLIRAADAPRLDYDAIIRMDYLLENVEGEIPQKWQVKASAMDMVSVVGVGDEKTAGGPVTIGSAKVDV